MGKNAAIQELRYLLEHYQNLHDEDLEEVVTHGDLRLILYVLFNVLKHDKEED